MSNKNNKYNMHFIITFTFILLLMSVSSLAAEVKLKDFSNIAENEELVLYLNQKTTEVAVENKSNGIIWYSNPPDRKDAEKIARGSAKDILSSQFRLSYYLPGNKQKFMNNYSDSVVFNQYQVNPIENGVSIDYTVGQKWADDVSIPKILSKKSFEEKVLAKLLKKDQDFLLKQYYLLTLKKMEEGEERVDVYKFDEEEVLGDYKFNIPGINMKQSQWEKFLLYFLGLYIDNRKDLESMEDIKEEDLNYLLSTPIYIQKRKVLPWDEDGITEAFKNSGYTPEDMLIDFPEINLEPPKPNIRLFKVTMEYILDGSNLVVRIPLDKVEYPRNVIDAESGGRQVTFPLYSLDLMQFFGAAGVNDQGYIFVPDGSGAIINLNNGKLDAKPYGESLYGFDYALESKDILPEITERLQIPVYGLKKEDTAFMAIIEKGNAYAAVKADIAGRTSSYNTVYSSFITMAKTELSYGIEEINDVNYLNLYQSRLPEGNIQIRYTFFAGKEATYVGMAQKYQQYLKEKYSLSKNKETDKAPFMLEIMGAIHDRKLVMGAPQKVVEPLTTFTQVKDVIEGLKENQIDNIDLRLTGWLSGGEYHSFPNQVNLEGKLGSGTDFDDLLLYLAKNKIDLYPDVSFINVYENKLLDGFRTRTQSAYFLNRKPAVIYEYNLSTYQKNYDKYKQILSTRYLDELIGDFVKDYNKYQINNLSLKYMGKQLNSDFRKDPEKTIDRQQSLKKTVEVVKGLKEEEDFDLLVEGGNSYLLPYVSHIVKMPLFSTGLNIIDRGVPFLPIALHGYIDYSGDPLNISRHEYALLKSVETGAIPYYQGTYSESYKVKRTDFDEYYALNYKLWLPQASDLYNRINNLLKEIYNQEIIDHQKISKNVYKTIYENGQTVIVNYNKEPVVIDGMEINAEDFKVIQGDL